MIGGQIAIFASAAALQLVAPMSAFASSVLSASFSGGAGTASVNGTEYATSGASLTLTVVTDSATRCVTLTGAHTGTSTSPSGSDGSSKTWTFGLTAANGADGVRNTTVAAYDDAGCSTLPTSTPASYMVDNTKPTIAAVATPAPNADGWNNTKVTVSFVALTQVPGFASAQARDLLENGVDQEAGGIATDFVGNQSDPAFVALNIDMDGPTLSGSLVGTPNGAGWFNSDVTVDWTCSDTGDSGFAAEACVTTLSSPARARA